MEERPFKDKANKPTEQAIQAVLGNVYPFYGQALDMAHSFKRTWTFTKSSGWLLKVHDAKKALFYLIILRDGLKISLTIRENERNAFLQDDELTIWHDAIAASKKYQEGFALQFDIMNEETFQRFALFMKKLVIMRS